MKIRNKETGEIIEVPEGAKKIRSKKTGQVIDLSEFSGNALSGAEPEVAASPEILREATPGEYMGALGRAINPITGFKEASSVYDQTLKASEGAAPAALEMLIGAPGSLQDKITSGTMALSGSADIKPFLRDAAEAVDPYVSEASAMLAGGVHPLLRPFMELGGLGVRAGRSRASEGMLALGGEPVTEKDVAELSQYVVNKRPTSLLPETQPIDTSIPAVNLLTGLGTDAVKNPEMTFAPLVAGKFYTGVAPMPRLLAEYSGLKKPRDLAAINQLREATPPATGTKLARNWDESAGNYLRLTKNFAEKWYNPRNPKWGDFFDAHKNAESQTLQELGKPRESMIQEAVAAGKNGTTASLKRDVSRMGDDPYFDNLDPQGAEFFRELSAKVPNKDIPVADLADLYTSLERQIRNARKKAGDAQAQLESNDKFQAMETMRHNVGAQLNELVSRRPNEWLDNSRDFADVYRVGDRVQIASEQYKKNPQTFRNLIKGGVGLTPAAFIKTIGTMFNRWLPTTSESGLARAVRLSKGAEFNEPTPFGPQKPTKTP